MYRSNPKQCILCHRASSVLCTLWQVWHSVQRAKSDCAVRLFCIEYLSLPGKVADEFCNGGAVSCARCNDRGAVRLSVRNVAGSATGKQSIELRLRHR